MLAVCCSIAYTVFTKIPALYQRFTKIPALYLLIAAFRVAIDFKLVTHGGTVEESAARWNLGCVEVGDQCPAVVRDANIQLGKRYRLVAMDSDVVVVDRP